jgi:hypothetical protein
MVGRTKKLLAWITGVGAGAIALVSDVGGAFTALRDAVTTLHAIQVSLLWPIGLAALIGLLLIFATRRRRPQSADVASLENNGQFYEKIQSQLCAAKREVVVVGLEKEWVFPLVVSVAIARSRNCKISVGFFHENHERYRLLELLGCEVVKLVSEKESDRFVGVLSDPDDILNCRATVRTARQSETIYGRHYFSALDYWAITASNAHIRGVLRSHNQNASASIASRHAPQFVEVADADVLALLKNVRFYDRAQLSFQDVVIAETRPVSSFVSRFKLNQVQSIIRLYEEKGWALFRPCGVTLANGNTSPLIPPVVEEHDGSLYVAEGHTRLFLLRRKGIKTVRAVVVRGVETDLPMTPTTWRRVDIVDDKREKGDPRLARYIETSTHSGVWAKSKDKLRSEITMGSSLT